MDRKCYNKSDINRWLKQLRAHCTPKIRKRSTTTLRKTLLKQLKAPVCVELQGLTQLELEEGLVSTELKDHSAIKIGLATEYEAAAPVVEEEKYKNEAHVRQEYNMLTPSYSETSEDILLCDIPKKPKLIETPSVSEHCVDQKQNDIQKLSHSKECEALNAPCVDTTTINPYAQDITEVPPLITKTCTEIVKKERRISLNILEPKIHIENAGHLATDLGEIENDETSKQFGGCRDKEVFVKPNIMLTTNQNGIECQECENNDIAYNAGVDEANGESSDHQRNINYLNSGTDENNAAASNDTDNHLALHEQEVQNATITTESNAQPSVRVPKKRGRKKGSKNKSKLTGQKSELTKYVEAFAQDCRYANDSLMENDANNAMTILPPYGNVASMHTPALQQMPTIDFQNNNLHMQGNNMQILPNEQLVQNVGAAVPLRQLQYAPLLHNNQYVITHLTNGIAGNVQHILASPAADYNNFALPQNAYALTLDNATAMSTTPGNYNNANINGTQLSLANKPIILALPAANAISTLPTALEQPNVMYTPNNINNSNNQFNIAALELPTGSNKNNNKQTFVAPPAAGALAVNHTTIKTEAGSSACGSLVLKPAHMHEAGAIDLSVKHDRSIETEIVDGIECSDMPLDLSKKVHDNVNTHEDVLRSDSNMYVVNDLESERMMHMPLLASLDAQMIKDKTTSTIENNDSREGPSTAMNTLAPINEQISVDDATNAIFQNLLDYHLNDYNEFNTMNCIQSNAAATVKQDNNNNNNNHTNCNDNNKSYTFPNEDLNFEHFFARLLETPNGKAQPTNNDGNNYDAVEEHGVNTNTTTTEEAERKELHWPALQKKSRVEIIEVQRVNLMNMPPDSKYNETNDNMEVTEDQQGTAIAADEAARNYQEVIAEELDSTTVTVDGIYQEFVDSPAATCSSSNEAAAENRQMRLNSQSSTDSSPDLNNPEPLETNNSEMADNSSSSSSSTSISYSTNDDSASTSSSTTTTPCSDRMSADRACAASLRTASPRLHESLHNTAVRHKYFPDVFIYETELEALSPISYNANVKSNLLQHPHTEVFNKNHANTFLAPNVKVNNDEMQFAETENPNKSEHKEFIIKHQGYAEHDNKYMIADRPAKNIANKHKLKKLIEIEDDSISLATSFLETDDEQDNSPPTAKPTSHTQHTESRKSVYLNNCTTAVPSNTKCAFTSPKPAKRTPGKSSVFHRLGKAVHTDETPAQANHFHGASPSGVDLAEAVTSKIIPPLLDLYIPLPGGMSSDTQASAPSTRTSFKEPQVHNTNTNSLTPIPHVAKLFAVSCLACLVPGVTHESTPKCHSSTHLYPTSELLKYYLNMLSSSELQAAYTFMYNRHMLYCRYFQLFCDVFIEKRNVLKLLNMVNDCARYVDDYCGSNLLHIYKCLKHFGISAYNACLQILKRTLLPSSATPTNATIDKLLLIIIDADWRLFYEYIEMILDIPDYTFNVHILEKMEHHATSEFYQNNLFFAKILFKCILKTQQSDLPLIRESKKLLQIVNKISQQCKHNGETDNYHQPL